MRFSLCLAGALIAVSAPLARAQAINMAGIQSDLAFIEQQAQKTLASLTPGKYPQANGQTGTWNTTNASQWTSGFFPGELWLLYQATGSTQWLNAAKAWTAPLAAANPTVDPTDIGFIIGASFGNGYRLTGNPSYKAEIFAAAKMLAANYNPLVGAVRSWTFGPWSYPVIVDGMMTLGPLEWGAGHGGDIAWSKVDAQNQASLTDKHLVRSDGSVIHLADFNPTTGAFLDAENEGAYSATATVSRTQAWGIYGYVQAYQMSDNASWLSIGEKLANFFIANLPANGVPPLDFDAPGGVTPPLDTSAAAIAADAFVMLGEYAATAAQRSYYLTEAEDILGSLSASFLATGAGSEAVLLDGTDGIGAEVDTALIYGDYYFLEALLRLEDVLQGQPTWKLYGPLWPTPKIDADAVSFAAAPEPSTWAMTALGLAALAVVSRRFRRRAPAT